MTDRPLTGLYAPQPRAAVLADLGARARARLSALPEPARRATLEGTVYEERRRLDKVPGGPGERERVEALAHALLHGGLPAQLDAAGEIVSAWADEIHGNFSMPTYRFATSVFPAALGALLNGRPERGASWNLDPGARITVEGPTELLRELVEESTLLLTPTHVSNLDSPIIGLALAMAGLPPFQYGAGLNLFSNPAIGWWMHRLGAYTVDRTKRADLYKETLKDYATRQLIARHHGLFFPGGTRSRSGAIESRVKKGLLGTGLAAWQEMVRAGRPDPDVYVVPLTLSFQLSLEANTLIEDHLAEAGKQRYIITDDEFAQPRQVLAFFGRVLRLDSAIVARFGEPIDVLGHPVPRDRAERVEASRRRLGYITDAAGKVEADPQRDHVYTERLADALCAAWPKLATLMTTHLVAWVAWRWLERSLGTTDPFRIVATSASQRAIPRSELITQIDAALRRAEERRAAGAYATALPATADEALASALDAFGRYHRSRALARHGDRVIVDDPRLCLYYRNRATTADLEGS